MRIHCVFGANGVGKSTILKELAAISTAIKVVHASAALKRFFGVDTYAELEAIDNEAKREAYTPSLLKEIATLPGDSIVFVDTHIVIPFQNGNTRQVESRWDPRLLVFVSGFVLIEADPQLVARRRKDDTEKGVRVRPFDMPTVLHDLAANLREWTAASRFMTQGIRITNNGSASEAAAKLLQTLLQSRITVPAQASMTV